MNPAPDWSAGQQTGGKSPDFLRNPPAIPRSSQFFHNVGHRRDAVWEIEPDVAVLRDEGVRDVLDRIVVAEVSGSEAGARAQVCTEGDAGDGSVDPSISAQVASRRNRPCRLSTRTTPAIIHPRIPHLGQLAARRFSGLGRASRATTEVDTRQRRGPSGGPGRVGCVGRGIGERAGRGFAGHEVMLPTDAGRFGVAPVEPGAGRRELPFVVGDGETAWRRSR